MMVFAERKEGREQWKPTAKSRRARTALDDMLTATVVRLHLLRLLLIPSNVDHHRIDASGRVVAAACVRWRETK